MSCILLHESLGNAIVDAAIPAIYSAILVLGAYLYTISLLTLLLSLFLVLAVANYWAFIYRPASLAHSRRKKKLRTIRHGDNQASRTNRTIRSSHSSSMTPRAAPRSVSTASYVWRLFNITKRSMQHGITLISFKRRRHIKSMASKREWCDMNRSATVQALVLTSQDSHAFSTRGPVGGANKSVRRLRSTSNPVPCPVTDMMTSSNLLKSSQSSLQKRSSLLSLFTEATDTSDQQRVLTTAGSFKIQRLLVPYILLDSRHFCSHLKSKLVDLTTSHSEEPLEVRESDLCRVFIELLEVFYPDGIALSYAEKDEACELYGLWKVTLEDDMNTKSPNSSSVEVLVVLFSGFEAWFNQVFMSLIRNTLSDRLLDNSLKRSKSHTSGGFKNTMNSSTSYHSLALLYPHPVVRERKISATTLDEWGSYSNDQTSDYQPGTFTFSQDQNDNDIDTQYGIQDEIHIQNKSEDRIECENKNENVDEYRNESKNERKI